MQSLIHLTVSSYLLLAETKRAQQWYHFFLGNWFQFPDHHSTANSSYAPAYEQYTLQFALSKSKLPNYSSERQNNSQPQPSQVTQNISWMMGLDENEPVQCATLLFTCEGYGYCPVFPIQHPAHTSSSTLLYQTVHVREQREGQDLPRLLAGVMHKTDPVVYMQRQKRKRGEGGNKCVN